MATTLTEELQILIPKISEIRNKAIDDAKTFSQAYNKKSLRDDARPNAVRHFVNVIEGTNLSLRIMATSMDDPDWWKCVAGRPLTPDEARFSIKAFYEAARVSLIQLLVSVVDTLFRRLLRSIEPGACKDATGEFQSIYKCLFKRLDSMPAEGEELLELQEHHTHQRLSLPKKRPKRDHYLARTFVQLQRWSTCCYAMGTAARCGRWHQNPHPRCHQ